MCLFVLFSSRSTLRIFILRVFILLSGSSLTGLWFNLIYPGGINPFIEDWRYELYKRASFIDLAKAREKLDNGRAIFIDVRRREAYDKGHIPGAINLNVSEFSAGRPEMLDFLPEEGELIVYSDNKDWQSAGEIVRLLETYNYKNIKQLKEGWEGWCRKSYPVEIKTAQ